MTESLVKYIENEVIPKYAAFDKAHREDHARAVIERALAMGRNYDINQDMLYAAAACHDLGLAVDILAGCEAMLGSVSSFAYISWPYSSGYW